MKLDLKLYYPSHLIGMCKLVLRERRPELYTEHFKEHVAKVTKHYPESVSFDRRVQLIAENNQCKCRTCKKFTINRFCSAECKAKFAGKKRYIRKKKNVKSKSAK